MKYQREVEVDITPVPEDLIDVEELLRVVRDFLDENEYRFESGDLNWIFKSVVNRYEDIGEILTRMKGEN